jgi:hypothetical protein
MSFIESAVVSGDNGTNIIKQDISLISGNSYNINVIYDLTLISNPSDNIEIRGFVKYLNSSSASFFALDTSLPLGPGALNVDFVPTSDVEWIGVTFNNASGTNAFSVEIESFEILLNGANQCKYSSFAILGAKQFQDSLGGNFGDYIMSSETTGKFLTNFKELKYPFYVNALIPASTFDESTNNDSIFLQIDLLDQSNTLVESISQQVDANSDGIYTINPNITSGACDWVKGTAKLISEPGTVVISEEMPLVSDCDCGYELQMRWLNDLSGWETWNFTQFKTIDEAVTKKVDIRRDITADFDNDFINGDTEYDAIFIESRKSITVRSQRLTKDQLDALSQIQRSIKPQAYINDRWVTVSIDKGSYLVRDEKAKTQELSFVIKLPNTLIQEQ